MMSVFSRAGAGIQSVLFFLNDGYLSATLACGSGVSPRTVRWGGTLLPQAIARAKGYITAARSAGLDLGAGSGPLDHTLGGKDIFTWMNGAPDAIQE